MKIAIDLDRTVFDCTSLIFTLGNMFNTKKSILRNLEYTDVNPNDAITFKNTMGFTRMSKAGCYYENQNSTEILKKWKDQGIYVTFLSSRVNYKSFQKQIVEWMEAHDVKYDKLVIGCKNKPKYCRFNNYDLLIDDTLKNCEDAASLDIPSIWYINQYNYKLFNELPDDIMYSITWNGIDEIVQKMFNEKIDENQK